MLWVAIGQAPGLFLYSYLGTLGQLGLNLARGKTHPRAVEYWVWLGGFGAAAIILILLGRIALRLLKKADKDSPAFTTLPPKELTLAPARANVSRGT
jgi:uncharacterized membrane protein YdjX (TVP38/TMEM64 family)